MIEEQRNKGMYSAENEDLECMSFEWFCQEY